MTIDGSFSIPLKRRRLIPVDSMEAEATKIKCAEVKEKFGREIRIFETVPTTSSTQTTLPENDDTDDFYQFTAEDYYRIMSTKKEDKYLKTKKIREAEEAARRARVTKAVMRVRFPDNHTLEATFHPSETIQSLVDLLKKAIAQPQLPFYLYTTPPKKQIKNLSVDFYSAGFIPGAIVYFSYDLPRGEEGTAVRFLSEDVMALKGLELIQDQPDPNRTAPEDVETAMAPPPAAAPQQKPAEKKLGKPKWLKM